MAIIGVSKETYEKIYATNYAGNSIRVFISYSSIEKGLAGEVKDFLEKYGLSVFLAHEDIKPTVDWQDEIIHNLKGCDVFVPILTINFSNSEFTDQETGMALALDKFIIPIKVEKDPYGFVGRLQACKFNRESVKDACIEIIQVIEEKALFRESLRDCLIHSLEKAYTFDGANEILKRIAEFKDFTRDQSSQMIRIAIKNNQVRMCREGRKFLPSFVKKYNSEIDSALKEVYGKIKDNFDSLCIIAP